MSQQYDLASLHSFLLHTPESGLRKMLVDNKSFTEVHFNLMLKIVKTCDEAAFAQHFTNNDYPKIKMSAAEQKIKDKFWSASVTVLTQRGLLTSTSSSNVA